MIYRVYTDANKDNWTDFTDGQLAIEFHAQSGFGEIEQISTEPAKWNKEAYCAEVSRAHSDWYHALIARNPDFDYESKGEVAMYLEHPRADLREQAKALTVLWFDSVELLYEHYDEVTEETADIDAFIKSLPAL